MADNSDPDADRQSIVDRLRPDGTGPAEPWLEAIPDAEGETVTFAPPQERASGDRTTAWLTIDAADVVDLDERR